MDKIFIDFETYYDRNYSLTKMTTIEYVRDPQFKVLGIAIQVNDEDPYWITGDQLPDYDWANSEVIAHNILFDGMILTQHYGVTAKRWTCTVALSRAMIPVKDHRLARLAKLLNLGEKGDALTPGSTAVSAELEEYAINDVVLAKKLYDLLIDKFPDDEKDLIHITQKWGVEPLLQIDQTRITASLISAIDSRQALIEASGVDEATLVSNQKFERYLIEQGIEVPTKAGEDNKWPKTALSKLDPQFWACVAKHPEANHIFQGRLAAKSNIAITRPKKLLSIAQCSPDNRLPMPLKYYGAHTGRWSGGDGYNVQNLPRDSEIRRSIVAPKGHVIVVVDSAQIELRVNAWWSDEYRALDMLKTGQDLYSITAAVHLDKRADHITESERRLGKVMVLGCGYGMGWRKFQAFVATGPMGLPPLLLSDVDAQSAIASYRRLYPNIKNTWREMDNYLGDMYFMMPDTHNTRKGVKFHKEHLMLPNGMFIWYPCLDSSNEGGGWTFGYTDNKSNIYGARLQENIVQGLARVIIADQLLEIERRGIRTVSSTHDEILAVVPEADAQKTLDVMLQVTRTSPVWAHDLPLDAKGGYDHCYSK